MTIGEKAWDILLQATHLLQKNNIQDARDEAELLLLDVTGWNRSTLYAERSKCLVADEENRYRDYVRRRVSGEPLAYIVGYRDFWDHRFLVTPDTLIPRSDSETLIEAVLGQVDKNGNHHILDMGTGSGCLLLSLLHEMPKATGVGIDISPRALGVAQKNAGIVGCTERVHWYESNWFDNSNSVRTPFSILISNPPYIPRCDIAELGRDVKDFEPLGALDGGDDGLVCYRQILDEMKCYLMKDSLVAFEVGIHQAPSVAEMMEKAQLKNINIFKDLCGIDRIVTAVFV